MIYRVFNNHYDGEGKNGSKYILAVVGTIGCNPYTPAFTARQNRNSLTLSKRFEMDIQALKIELVKQILESESMELLHHIYSTLKREEKDFWLELTDDQKMEVEIGRRQVQNGETEDWENVFERLSKKAS